MQVSLVKSQYVEFNIPEPVPEAIILPNFNGTIRPGSIPSQVKRIDAVQGTITELLPGSIPDSVTHLYLEELTSSMVIPSSVTHLVVLDFKKDMIAFVPSTVTHLYVHAVDHTKAPADRDHYFFTRGTFDMSRYFKGKGYNLGEQFEDDSFGSILSVIKRTIDSTTTEPTPVPIDTEPVSIDTELKSVPIDTEPEPEQTPSTEITVGKTYTDLGILESVGRWIVVPAFAGSIRPGSIPERIVCVNLKNCDVTELEPGVITDSVTHLFLRELNGRMTIPASVKYLAILNFKRCMLRSRKYL